MKVLIVDDNVAVQEIIKDILGGQGYTTLVASTVDEAVEIYVSSPPQIVLLDTWVGDEDGLRMISGVREAGLDGGLNIILIKSSSELVPKDNPYIKGFIDKPFKSSDVLEIMRSTEAKIEMVPEAPVKKKHSLFRRRKEPKIQNTGKDLNEQGIVYGRSYVFFEPEPDRIYRFMGMFDHKVYRMLVVTTDKVKAIKERLDYGGIEVLSLTSGRRSGTIDVSRLGSLMAYVKEFISNTRSPVVVFDCIDEITDAAGLNDTLVMLHQLIQAYGGLCTFVVSMDPSKLTDKDRSILQHDMRQFNID